MTVNFEYNNSYQPGTIAPTYERRNNMPIRPISSSNSQGTSLRGRVIPFPQIPSESIEAVMQWKLEAEEGENRGSAANSIVNFLQNKKETNLFLKDYGLKSLPDIFDDQEFDRLRGISIKGNWITHLPSTFVKLKSLEAASVVDNLLFELPKDISQLTSLKMLDVSQNPFLTELPSTLPKNCAIRLVGDHTGITEDELKRVSHFHSILRS